MGFANGWRIPEGGYLSWETASAWEAFNVGCDIGDPTSTYLTTLDAETAADLLDNPSPPNEMLRDLLTLK
jgi:hypothetical protein